MKCLLSGSLRRINVALVLINIACMHTAFSFAIDENTEYTAAGTVSMRVYQDVLQENGYEDKQEVDTRIRSENEIAFKEQEVFLTINLEARYEAFIGQETQKDVDVLLREAFVEIRRPRYTFSVGRQIITWGKLDDITIVDRMNPQDYKWFLLNEKQERKEPVFMAKLDLFGDNFDLEAVYIPFFEPSYVNLFSSDWAVFGHLNEIVTDQGAFPSIGGLSFPENERRVERTFDNGQIGLRFRSRVDDIDYALYYLYVNNSVPTLRESTANGNIVKRFLYLPEPSNLAAVNAAALTSADLTLEREYPRVHVIGGDLETVVGDFGVRLETAMVLEAPYLRSDFSYMQRDTLLFGIGSDYTDEAGWYYNLQFVENIIFNYEDMFAQEETTHLMTFTARKEFLRGRLLFDLDCAYNFSFGDRMFNPQLVYRFGNGVEFTLGGFVFDGGVTTLLGRFSDKDLLYLELLYRF